jgi:hypothetical protein
LSTHLGIIKNVFLNVESMALIWVHKNVHSWFVLELF